MSDSTGHRRDETAPVEKPWKKDTKNVPPLVWLVIAALAVIVAVAVFYGQKTTVSPSGDVAPAAASDTDTLPPEPPTVATTQAPATPGG